MRYRVRALFGSSRDILATIGAGLIIALFYSAAAMVVLLFKRPLTPAAYFASLARSAMVLGAGAIIGGLAVGLLRPLAQRSKFANWTASAIAFTCLGAGVGQMAWPEGEGWRSRLLLSLCFGCFFGLAAIVEDPRSDSTE